MRSNTRMAWGVVFITLLWLVSPTGARAKTIVVRGGTIFDSHKGIMLADRAIVIESGRITFVGAEDHLPRVPSDAIIIDARNKYIIPGLIDAHVHLVHVLDFAHITGDEVLPLFLASGVTSLRDVGDEIVAEKLIARYAEAHPELCPRVFLCSPLLDGVPPYHGDNGVSDGVSSPEEVPGLVEDVAAWGAVTVKLYVGIGRPVGKKVIEEAHRRGLVVTGHLGKYSAQDAVADGIDCLEHIVSVFSYILPADGPKSLTADERRSISPAEAQIAERKVLESRANLDLNTPKAQDLIQSIVRGKVMVDPTLAVFRDMLLLPDLPEVYDNPDNAFVPTRLKQFWPTYLPKSITADTLDLRKKEFSKYEELTGVLYRAGATVLAGTDTPEPYTPPGTSMHQELKFLVESGLPPAAALQSATINNAQAIKQENELGSIDVGKRADMVILNANPLDNIDNTRKIYKVLRGGNVSDPGELLKAVPKD